MYELNNPTLVKSIRDSLTGYMVVRVLIGPRSDSQKTQYTGNDIISCKIAAGLFNGDPSVGNAVSRKLTLSVARKTYIDLGQEVKIIAQCRDTDGRTSEVIPVGTFYIVSRKLTDDVYTLECYDRMYKANTAYPYSPSPAEYSGLYVEMEAEAGSTSTVTTTSSAITHASSKNLFDPTWALDTNSATRTFGRIYAKQTSSSSTLFGSSGNPIGTKLVPGTYHFSASSTNTTLNRLLINGGKLEYDINGTKHQVNVGSTFAVTSDDFTIVRVYTSQQMAFTAGNTYNYEIQLEPGTAETSYEVPTAAPAYVPVSQSPFDIQNYTGYNLFIGENTLTVTTGDVQYTVPSATVVQNAAAAMNMSLADGTLAAMVRPMDYPGVIRTADDEVEVYPSTCREMLRQAAAVNGGNFIISNDGKLKFVPIWQSVSDYIYSECESKDFPNGSDPESVTSVYSYMAVRIFVEGVVAARAYNTETLKNPFDVHLDGSLMQTQAQLDATASYILSIIQGKNITGYNIKNAIINPAVELGDYFKSLPTHSLTHCVAAYNMVLDSLYTADLSSPFTDEGGDTVWEA